MKKDTKSYRILIIEKSEEVLLSLKKLLLKRIKNPEIVSAIDFKSSKKLMSEEHFDIILLDLNLPDLQGQALLDAIGKENFYKVIILSEPTDVNLTLDAISQGISDYLIKTKLSSRLLHKSIVYAIERKKNIANLEESEKRYSDLFYFNPQPMYLFDFETLKILRVNDAMVRQYGYSSEEFLEKEAIDIRPHEDVCIFEKALEYLETHNRLVSTQEYRHQKKNGEIIFVEIACNVIYLEGRKCGLVLAIDVTERVTYIKAIEERNQRLQDIAFTQSHIVRAPLANMMGILYLIRDFDLKTEEGEELLQHFITCGLELDKNIKEIVLKSNFFEVE